MSSSFATATVAVQRSLPLMLDENVYAFNAETNILRNFLIDLIRSEQGTGDKLTHFAADLNKLGTTIAGLTQAGQDAIIAQGIEWYYWQGTGYAGQFFVNNVTYPSLLQYTTAIGAALPGAQNKADKYLRPWISAVYTANSGDAGYPPFGAAAYSQWNVAGSLTIAVSATALDPTKSQIFIGQGGADNFTGGNLSGVLLGGIGNDSLDGGTGSVNLQCHRFLAGQVPGGLRQMPITCWPYG